MIEKQEIKIDKKHEPESPILTKLNSENTSPGVKKGELILLEDLRDLTTERAEEKSTEVYEEILYLSFESEALLIKA